MQHFLSGEPPSTEDIENALLDFGFYHPLKDGFRMYSELVNNKHYGYAGGVMDQPEEYWHDMTIFKWLELWVRHIAPMPKMEQVSVFDTLRKTGRIDGAWLGGRNA